MNAMITLYPSNWLYNAGVVGFLRSLIEVEEVDIKDGMLSQSGELHIPMPFFSQLQVKDRYFGEKKIASIVGKSTLYRNYLQANQKEFFADFVKSLDSVAPSNQCNMCGMGWSLEAHEVAKLKKGDPGTAKFLDRIKNFNIVHNSLIGPSINEFPNAFWSLRQSAAVCYLCSFLIIHHHLALTRLSDNSEIFINAPSFKVMYHLNEFAKETFGATSSQEARGKREILAMSVIEYATKLQTSLGVWTGMNIEVVTRRGGEIEFFSLPYEVIELLADRRLASLLSQIGEFAILNFVLNQDFSRLVELGYRLLRIGLKTYGEWGKAERDFVNQELRLGKNRQNPARVAEQIFQLSALIEEQRKRRETHERIGLIRS